MSPRIHDHPLPYVDRLPERAADAVTLVVIHCTELPDLATARTYGERVLHEDGTGNSGHFYIDRDGSVHGWVPGTRVAHHVRGQNAHSIGIELVNLGRYPHWWDSRHQSMTEPYPPAQIASLRALLAWLREGFSKLEQVAGHEDLDTDRLPASDDLGKSVPRKRDPGPLFPWELVLQDGGLERIAAGCATAP